MTGETTITKNEIIQPVKNKPHFPNNNSIDLFGRRQTNEIVERLRIEVTPLMNIEVGAITLNLYIG